MAKLIVNGKEATIGMELISFRGEKATLISWREPHKIGSTGKVYVEWENKCRGEYYPDVFNGEFIP